MPINVTMPKWGLTMKQGKITRWFKQEGDAVAKGEPFFEVETEKITNSVEAADSGTLFQIVAPAGSTVPVGAVVAILALAGETPERVAGGQAAAAQAPAAAPAAQAAAPPAAAGGQAGFVPASPAARRLAKELGVELARVKGSGPGGRVTEDDVRKFHEQGPPPPKATPVAEELARQAGLDLATVAGSGEGGKITKADVEKALAAREAVPALPAEVPAVRSLPYAGMRRAIAANMHGSLQNTAQLTMFNEVDVTECLRFLELVRREYRQDETVRVSLNDIIALAVSRALKRHPLLNSNLAGEEILVFDAVHLGVAVALPEGLIVPVVRDADRKGLLQIAKEVRGLAQKARQGGLAVDEVTGGTFTISNLNGLGAEGFTPVLKPPETAILGVGRVKDKPAVHEGQIAIRSLMYLSLTFDHQVVDGAPAAEFLATLARYLENPYLIMS